jgi:hypothetical protein
MEIINFLTTFGCPLNPTSNILVKKKRLLRMWIALIRFFDFLIKGLLDKSKFCCAHLMASLLYRIIYMYITKRIFKPQKNSLPTYPTYVASSWVYFCFWSKSIQFQIVKHAREFRV